MLLSILKKPKKALGSGVDINYSFLITEMVHLVAIAAIAPKAASQGANNVPTIPAQAGISKRVLPFSSYRSLPYC